MILLRYKSGLLIGYGEVQSSYWAVYDKRLRLWLGPVGSEKEAKRVARRMNWTSIKDALKRIKARWDEWVGCYP